MSAVRVVTWNVNSVRARMPRVEAWLSAHQPEIVCLQETKCRDEEFPLENFEKLGYHVAFHGQRTYNGVAILSREEPTDVVKGMPDDDEKAEARVIAATVGGLRVLNVYVVNGKEVGDVKYDYKLDWLDRLANYVASFDLAGRVVLVGDFNITFDDRDVYDPDKWRDKILCSVPERDALAKIMAPGLTDALRRFHDDAGIYTWWDFRTRGFQRDRGLRIDHVLCSPSAMEACTGVEVDKEERGGEKPSDHAPVTATFEVDG